MALGGVGWRWVASSGVQWRPVAFGNPAPTQRVNHTSGSGLWGWGWGGLPMVGTCRRPRLLSPPLSPPPPHPSPSLTANYSYPPPLPNYSYPPPLHVTVAPSLPTVTLTTIPVSVDPKNHPNELPREIAERRAPLHGARRWETWRYETAVGRQPMVDCGRRDLHASYTCHMPHRSWTVQPDPTRVDSRNS